jgi:hypothetical protein
MLVAREKNRVHCRLDHQQRVSQFHTINAREKDLGDECVHSAKKRGMFARGWAVRGAIQFETFHGQQCGLEGGE